MNRALVFVLCGIAYGCTSQGKTPDPATQSVTESAPPKVVEAKSAKEVFRLYVDLEHAFDPAVASLYSDDALIKNTRHYPTGQTRETVIPAPQYKELIRSMMPLAKSRGDLSDYSDVSYKPEGDRVRVLATRYSRMKDYESPMELLLEEQPDGRWLIIEEIAQSQP